MSKEKKLFPFILSTAIFIAMEIAALNMISHNQSLQGLWISRAGHQFMASAWGSWQQIRYYASLGEANEGLARENFELREALQHFRTEEELALMSRNADSLMRHLSVKGFAHIPAQVIKISNNKQHNYLILDKGAADGVTEQCGIITGKGVVGIVEVVGEHYSYALSFKNTDASVSARLGLEGTSGPMSWDGIHPSTATLREIPLQNKFAVGDTLYTSGHSSIFPPEIPLGVVSGSRIVNGATYEIAVDLFQDFSKLRYVTIVKNLGRSEIEKLEHQAETAGI